MINNLAKLAIENGGSVTPILIPSELTGGTGLCNPSINIIDGELKLNLRHVQYTFYHSEGKKNFPSCWGPLSYLNPEDDITLTTENYICNLDPNTLNVESFTKVDTSKLDVKPIWEFVGLEDARLVKWEGREFLCGVRRDTTPNGEGRMELSEIVDGKEIARYRIQPPGEYTYCEKNWMPINDMPFHFVKWSNPTEVVKVDLETLSSETIHLSKETVKTKRDLRGGSHVVKYGKYYIALTHEVDLWFNNANQKDSQYYHRFIIWDENWNVVKVTDEFKFLTGEVEFACGMVIYNNNLLISFGFQDNAAFILQLPTTYIDEILHGNEFIPQKYQVKTPLPLLNFIDKPFDSYLNFQLGDYYYMKGHTAASLSLFLRCAEYGDDKDLIYESLLKAAMCLTLQGKRLKTEKSAYENAISFQPDRPEAYFLISQYYEKQKDWFMSNHYADLALYYKDNLKPTKTNIGVDGKYVFLFQKAVSCWWVGQVKKSKEIFLDLTYDYGDVLNEKFKNLVKQNLSLTSSTPYPHILYTSLNHQDLKYKFRGSKNIKRNYSQTYQDMFVLTVLDGKENGKYLEIGAADPLYGNNTALLEKQFNWDGISVEILEYEVNKFRKERKNPIHHGDASKVDYKSLLQSISLSNNFDYLQIDCDPPSVTYNILTMIPFDEYKFAVITFEHDYYADPTKKYRDLSREYLISKGYELVVSNVSPNDNCPYEDWWVHPDLVDKNIINRLKSDDDTTKNIKEYILQPKK
jgi:hypothetical protein